MTYEEQQKALRAQVPKGTAGATELASQGFTDVGTGVDTSQPSPTTVQTGLSKVGTSSVGPDGKPIYDVFSGTEHIQDPSDPRLKGVDIAGLPEGQAPTGFQSKFQTGFNQANQALGDAARDVSSAKGSALTSQYAPSKHNDIASAFIQQDEVIGGLVKAFQDFVSPKNQRTSLRETYDQMIKDSGVQAIDTELLDMKKVIEGSEDDLRTEITKAGGFATESQVQALTNSRNKQLIKNYNQLINLRNSKEKYLQTSIGLEQADRQSADQRFESMFNMGAQIATMQQQMQTNARNQMQWLADKTGFDGLYDATGGDPYYTSLVENTLGLPQGGLLSSANQARLARTQEKEKTKLELEKIRGEIKTPEERKAELEKKLEDIKLTKAQREKIFADIKKERIKTGIEAITLYQHEQATRVLSSTNNLINRVSGGVVGSIKAKVARFIPGTEAADFKAEVEQLKTQIFTRELAAMRDASKTGGAVGNVSDTEGDKLSNTLGSLSLDQSPEQFKKNLTEIQDSLNRWYSALVGENVILAPDGTLKRITN